MKYRMLDNEKVSVLGYGCMRLPVLEGDIHSGPVDLDEAVRLIRYAIDQGVNYIDTAYPYHHETGENVVGEALRDGYRQRVLLTTKLPVSRLQSPEDCDRILNEQLRKLETESVDFYLLHGLTRASWKRANDLHVLDFIAKAKQDGRIHRAGFSFHDELPLFKEIVNALDWSMCQIMLNYMDIEYQAGLKGLEYAATKGLSVAVMEPLRGGRLVNPPADIAALFRSFRPSWSPVEWALRWVLSRPEVSVVLSGMSRHEQVVENVRIAENAELLSDDELEVINQARQLFLEKRANPCTACGYCMPCPKGVLIPGILGLHNDTVMFNAREESRAIYRRTRSGGKSVDACTQCGRCEAQCPRHLPIRTLLKEAHAELEERVC